MKKGDRTELKRLLKDVDKQGINPMRKVLMRFNRRSKRR
jgi:hypothetical protein